MSGLTYVNSDIDWGMTDKPLVWLHGAIKTPPFSPDARMEAGVLLRHLQRGDKLALPHSRPLPDIGPRCHELRVRDKDKNWRIVYRTDSDAVLIGAVFQKTTRTTQRTVIDTCRRRFRDYDIASRKES